MTHEPARENNAHFLRVTSATANATRAGRVIGLSNEGFRGMGVKAGEAYDFSTQIRVTEGNPKLTVQLYGEDGTNLATQTLSGATNTWSKLALTLVPKDTDAHARLAIFMEGSGTVDLDMVSLFPRKTWMI